MLKEEKKIKQTLIDIKEFYKNEITLEDNILKIENLFDRIKKFVDDSDKKKLQELIEEVIDRENNEKYKIVLLSFLMNLSKENKYVFEILSILNKSKDIKDTTKFSIFNQVNYFISVNINKINKEILQLQKELYINIVNNFKNKFLDLNFIDEKQRNKEFIMIFATQLLNAAHMPTKVALDFCYNLTNELGKKIILVDTNELLSENDIIPFYGMLIANKEKINQEIKYKETSIYVYQIEEKMPEISEYKTIIDVVKKYKPYLIFSIGDKSIISDVCNELVPVINISMSCNIPITENKIILPYEEITEKCEDKKMIDKNLKSMFDGEVSAIDLYNTIIDSI